MEKNSRRKFIRNAALTSLAVCSLPTMKSLAAAGNKPRSKKAKEGMVILFQGDSITDGNRGRTADLNHIMGHGYASASPAG
jgi:hypothetical protein